MALSGKNFDFSGPGGSLYYCDGDAKSTTACNTSGFTIRNYTYHTWLRTNSFKTGGKNVTKIRLWAHDTSATSYYGYKGILGLSSTLYNPSDYSSSIPSFTYSGQTGTNYYETYAYNTYYVDLDVNLNPNTDYYMYVGVASGGAWQAVNYSSSSRYTHYYVEFLTSSQATYTITYNNNGGSGGPGSATMNWGSGTLSTTKPTRTGYQFNGWNTAKDGSGTSYAAGASYTATANTTLYAQWTANVARIAYNINSGSLDGTKTDYSLNQYNFIIKASGSNWDFHQISYGNSDDPYNASTFGLYRTGYTFGGWYIRTESGNTAGDLLDQATSYESTKYTQYNDSSKSTTNTASVSCYLYAGWTANTYTVTFNKNNGDSVSQASKTVTYNSTYGTLPTASRVGYTFAGWYTAASGGTQVTSTTTVTITAAQTLYAHWTVNSYAFTLGSSTGVSTTNSSATGDYNYGTTITLKATVNDGYTWSKWQSSNTSLQADITTTEGSFKMPAGALTMTPVVTTNGYTIVFNANGGTGSMTNMVCNYGTTYNLTVNAYTRSGYTFLGWSTNSTATTITYTDKQQISNLSTTNGATITLYAIWEAKSQMFIWTTKRADGTTASEGKWIRVLKYVYSSGDTGTNYTLTVKNQTIDDTHPAQVASTIQILDENGNTALPEQSLGVGSSVTCTLNSAHTYTIWLSRSNGRSIGSSTTGTITATPGTNAVNYKTYILSSIGSNATFTFAVASSIYEV